MFPFTYTVGGTGAKLYYRTQYRQVHKYLLGIADESTSRKTRDFSSYVNTWYVNS